MECPEELDTRFSKFAPPPFEDISESLDSLSEEDLQDAAEVLDLFKKINGETEVSDSPVQELLIRPKRPLPSSPIALKMTRISLMLFLRSFTSLTILKV